MRFISYSFRSSAFMAADPVEISDASDCSPPSTGGGDSPEMSPPVGVVAAMPRG